MDKPATSGKAMKGAREDIEKAVSDLATHTKIDRVRRSRFASSVVSISDDHSTIRARLCTGKVIDVPASILKNVEYLGTMTNDEDRCGIVSGEIDVSTDVGRFIQQMAHEIMRLSGSALSADERLSRSQGTSEYTAVAPTGEVLQGELKEQFVPFDRPLPFGVIKLPFTAIAGFPHQVRYLAPTFQYLTQWSVTPLHCVLTRAPFVFEWVTGHPDQVLGISFVLEAPPGTPVGITYNAQIDIFGVLVQATT
jgi:hypothetical protein